jgi:pimeloyl-ACP methyl ester carboxylesterase
MCARRDATKLGAMTTRGPRRVRLWAGALAAAAALAYADSAHAAAAPPAFRACRGAPAGVTCASIPVPLDRTGAVPGTITLAAQKRPAPQFRTGALFALAGGPGQPAVPFLESFAEDLAPALQTRDLVVFDQRGTGKSGFLRCTRAERTPGDFGEMCAAELGPRAHSYTTLDSVEDIEAVRRVVGIDRIALYGVSYGTKVAVAYALRYPMHVEFLVLDSVVTPDGPDPLERSSYRAIPRIVDSICAAGACRGVTHSPTRDLARLLLRMREGKVEVVVPTRRGPARVPMGASTLQTVLVEGVSRDPMSASRLPAAIRAALAGDGHPLGRLALGAGLSVGSRASGDVSRALNIATLCEEAALPWARTAPVGERVDQARSTLRRTPSSEFAPFGRPRLLDLTIPRMCLHWPAAPSAPTISGTFPDVPVLVVNGALDALTPASDAEAVARRFPRASLVIAPNVGHSVFGVEPFLNGSCASTALERFVAGQPVGTCTSPAQLRIAPVPPRSFRTLGAWRGVPGRRGKTVRALLYTLDDVRQTLTSYVLSEGRTPMIGLRGGKIGFAGSIAGLERVEFVSGVVVSGRWDMTARIGEFTISGVGSSGTVRIEGSRVAGVLDGRRISAAT